MLLVRACGVETFVPWTLLERAGASCLFMLELNFHSGSSITQVRLTSRSDCYRTGALEDSDGPSYNLRERLSNQFNERKAGKNDSDLKDESCGLVGSEFHAEAVPDCYGRVSLSIVREPEPQYFDDDFLHDFCISTLKITSCLVDDVIASPWISPLKLKHLFASFHEIGVALHKIKHLKKVSLAFELCIVTVWNCVRLLCLKFVNVESNSSDDFVSGEAVIDFVTEACSKSAFYLDVLELHGEQEIEKLGLFILENWSEAKNLITRKFMLMRS
ncbi:hypothetical protein DY000_02028439 [Brassica cretica]|uniref:FBD domain-containing protein n=1 Tax=Brassica cretica TaxID=69181 RepID=A0ABQ7DXP9_BRACR|nr:hypothetical protein DY000_02028439 [Brassica cretica]